LSEARGEIIALIITLIPYALQITLDIATLGITHIFGGFHRYTPIII